MWQLQDEKGEDKGPLALSSSLEPRPGGETWQRCQRLRKLPEEPSTPKLSSKIPKKPSGCSNGLSREP